jgi:glycosyltransferase involved in cell wall biosynthesis
MKRHRIAHILPWPSVGGVEMATLRAIQAVEGEGFSGVAFTPRGGTAVRALFDGVGLPVVEYDAPEPSYRHFPSYLRRSIVLARQLRAARVDLVHCADVLAGFRCGLAGAIARVPVIMHVRGRLPSLSKRDRSFFWPIRRLLFVSQETCASFAFKVPEARSAVLYDGIDLPTTQVALGIDARAAVRAELGIPLSAPVIGMIARVAPAKDYPTLIDAAAQVIRAHPARIQRPLRVCIVANRARGAHVALRLHRSP